MVANDESSAREPELDMKEGNVAKHEMEAEVVTNNVKKAKTDPKYSWEKLCDAISSVVHGEMSPSQLQVPTFERNGEETTEPGMKTYEDIERGYRIHNEESVTIPVSSLKTFQYFRLVHKDNQEYKSLVQSFRVRRWLVLCNI